MSAVQVFQHRIAREFAAVALVAVAIIGWSVPCSTSRALHGLEQRAVQKVAPIASRTLVGRYVLAVTSGSDAAPSCNRS